MANYYLYIDDSAKFPNKKDTHVFYSFILLDKKGRDKFNEEFVNASKEIRPLGKHIGQYDKKELNNWYAWLEEKNKGNLLYTKYNAARKRNNKLLTKKYERILELHKYSLDFGVICWCKIKFSELRKNDSKSEDLSHLKKKKKLLLIIIKKLVEKKIIKDNSSINIFIDEETDDGLTNEFKASEIKYYLNFKSYSPQIIANRMQYFIRKKRIKIKKVEYLESQMSFPIQYADIIANLANKLIIKKKNIEEVCEYFCKENLKVNCIIYPKLNTINLAKNEKCC